MRLPINEIRRTGSLLADFASRAQSIAYRAEAISASISSCYMQGGVSGRAGACASEVQNTVAALQALSTSLTAAAGIYESNENQLVEEGQAAVIAINNGYSVGWGKNASVTAVLGAASIAVPMSLSVSSSTTEQTTTQADDSAENTQDAKKTNISFLSSNSENGEFEAYLGKIDSTESVAIGAVSVGTTFGITAATVRGYATSGWDVAGNSKSTKAKEGGKIGISPSNSTDPVTYDEYDGTTKDKENFNVIKAKVSAGVGATVGMLDYEFDIGTEDYGGSVDANIKLLDADVGVEGELSFGDEGLAVVGKAEIGASLAEVEASAAVNISGVKAEAKVSAEIGVGASFEVGYIDGEFKIELGAALGVGGKIAFKIKLPELW